jgi:hypothetical protein
VDLDTDVSVKVGATVGKVVGKAVLVARSAGCGWHEVIEKASAKKSIRNTFCMLVPLGQNSRSKFYSTVADYDYDAQCFLQVPK